MNLGRDSSGYRKIRLRSEKSRRWAKMREQRGDRPLPPQSPEAAAAFSDYLVEEEDPKSLKWAGVAAIVAHFILFLVVIPVAQPEPIEYERTAAVVVKRYQPPSPPAKAKKTQPKKKKTRVPIPDPTPDEPEPLEPEEYEGEFDYGDFDADYQVGAPDGVPGVSTGARDGAFRAGEGGIISPQIVRKVDPEYTPEATRRGIQGEVWIEAVVDAQGRVQDPRLLRGLPDEELNQRAMEAIQRWQFRPGMKDGEPVPVIAVFTVTYRLH